MVMCDCVKCCGNDEHIVCENQLISIQSGIFRAQKFNTILFVIAISLCALGLLGNFK